MGEADPVFVARADVRGPPGPRAAQQAALPQDQAQPPLVPPIRDAQPPVNGNPLDVAPEIAHEQQPEHHPPIQDVPIQAEGNTLRVREVDLHRFSKPKKGTPVCNTFRW